MSILNNNNQPKLTQPQIVAETLKQTTRQTYQMMVNSFNSGAVSFWQNPTASPQEIASALGSDAKEVFELHYKLGQLLASINPNSITKGLSVIGQFTMNNNGTVSVINN